MRELLSNKASRANSYQVVAMVGTDYDLYKELIGFVVNYESPISEKAAWAMNHCFEEKAGFFEDYLSELVPIIGSEIHTDSVKRNIVKILQFIEIPEKYRAEVIDSCFDLVTNKKTAIAVKAFSLGVLENMVKLYPELKSELVAAIEELLPKASSGLKNRGQHILRRLSN
ncbi:MAG: hypothetical protein ABF242_06805 [Flavobacteriales bacterium]